MLETLKDLEQIVYFNSYVIINPGENNELTYKQLLSETDWQVLDATKTNINDIEISIGAEFL